MKMNWEEAHRHNEIQCIQVMSSEFMLWKIQHNIRVENQIFLNIIQKLLESTVTMQYGAKLNMHCALLYCNMHHALHC